MENNGHDLKKILGFWDSVAIIIAIVIGVGIFRVPSEVARYLNSPGLVLLAWLAGGIISALGCLCYAELSSSFPKTGGNYVYLRESYGPWAGFLFGWTEFLAVRTGSIAAVSFIFAEYLQSLLSLDKSLVKPVAVSVILAISVINGLGLKYSKSLQNLITVPKILSLVGIILFGIISKKGSFPHFDHASFDANQGVFLSFGLALIPILWTYGGWHENTFMAGETRNAKKTIPLALLAGILVVTVLYVAINFVYLYLIPAEKMVNSDLIAANVLEILCGQGGRKALEIFIIISSLGCINAMIMTGSRVTYAMAKDNIIFRYIGKVSSKQGVPFRAIIINAVWSIMLTILGTFNQLLFFTGILVWLFFAFVAGGLFVLRHKFPDLERPYKAWGYPIMPVIFIGICIALVLDTMFFYPFQSLIGLCLLISGIPVFIVSHKKGHIYKSP